MPERPINLRDWQVQAAKAGRLRQVRLPIVWPVYGPWDGGKRRVYVPRDMPRCAEEIATGCPHGSTGEVLWVREMWQAHDVSYDPWSGCYEVGYPLDEIPKDPTGVHVSYAADGDDGPWRSAQHMPKWASRFAFTVAAVYAQQAGEMTEAEAEACAINDWVRQHDGSAWGNLMNRWCRYTKRIDPNAPAATTRSAFAAWWDARYGKRHPWAPRLWQWVLDLEPKEDADA